VLPDGAQRGNLVEGVREVRSSLMLNTGRAPVVVAEGTSRDASARLRPVAFDPGALQARVPNERLEFNIVGFGDSYAAGEGAPEGPGELGADGVPNGAGEHEEDWDLRAIARRGTVDVSGFTERTDPGTSEPRPNEERLARACHRSGVNGTRVAADTLHREWPQAGVNAESFACSGAKILNLVSDTYVGPDGFDKLTGWTQRPQIDQYRASLLASPRAIDAVTIGVGGNDAEMFNILLACLLDSVCGLDIPGNPLSARGVFNRNITELAGRYARLNSALAATRTVPSNHVFLTSIPSPLQRSAAENCATVELTGWPLAGAPSALVFNPLEIAFIQDDVFPSVQRGMSGGVQREMSAAASRHGWRFVNAHVRTFATHGWCTPQPWFGTLSSGLDTQGADINGLPFLSDALRFLNLPPLPLTGGVAHPNADGYRLGYGPAIADALRPLVRARVRPSRPDGLRVSAQSLFGAVTVRWNDRSTTETEFVLSISRNGGAPVEVRAGRGDARTEHTIPSTSAARLEVTVKACHVGEGVEECSLPSAPLRISNTRPAVQPAMLSVRDSFCNTACNPARMVWQPVVDPSFAHLFYEVEVDGVPIATQSNFLEVGTANSFRVRSCNLIGCGAYSAAHAGPREHDARSATSQMLASFCQGVRSSSPQPGEPSLDPAGLCQ
jgi:lysophospholipase L1-like esterase